MCMHNNGEPSFVANTPDCHSLFQLAFFIVLSRIPCSLGIPDQLLCDTLVNRPITKRANPMQVHPIRSRVTVDIRRHTTSLTIVPAESTRVFGVQRKLSWFGAGDSGVKREQCAFTNDFLFKRFQIHSTGTWTKERRRRAVSGWLPRMVCAPSYELFACFISSSVVMLLGRSSGNPSARSHTREASTPSARDTPNRTV